MNKAYRQVYKDGIGWVAIAENASCVSSSKGSGTVVEKSGVEILKNFFDLRNSVVLNNGFLLKGLFAATLFCGVFVGDLKAAPSKQEIEGLQEIAKIQNNGTTVYTGNDGYRMEKVVNPDGSIGFKGRFDKSIIDRIDSNGVVEIGGRHFVIPTGSLLKDKSQLTEKDFIFFEVVKDGSGNWHGKTFGDYKKEGKTDVKINLDREVVQYDAQEKKWYIHNHAETSPSIKEGRKLYYGKKEDGTFGFATWNYLAGIPLTNPKDKDGIGNPEMIDGYYKIKSETILAKVEIPLGTKIGDDFVLSKPERLSLVGKDGINTTPQTYIEDDKTNGKIPNGRRVGDNKDGNIRLGNVARAIYDDEAINLGQLNEKLENSKTHYVSIKSSTIKDNYYNDGAKSENAIAIGPNAQAKSQNVVSIGESAGKTSLRNGNGSIFIGRNAGKDSDVLDPQSVENWGAVYIGQDAGKGSKGDGNLYLGSDAGFKHQGSQNIFLGDGARNLKDQQGSGENEITKGNRNIAIGNQYVHNPAKVYGEDDALNDTITIGTATRASANGAIAIGSAYNYSYDEQSKLTYYTATSANGVRSIALGSGILVNSENGVAIGFGSGISDEKVTDAVALGSYSKASREALDDTTKKDVYLGDNEAVAKTVVNTKGAISVGSTIEGLDAKGNKVNPFTRQITNLAAGTKDTDAVNVAQLKTGLNSKANLDGTNLFEDIAANKLNPNFNKDNWRKALDVSDANIQNLAKGSVEVKAADGQDIVEVSKKVATDKDTYTVSVNADKLASNTTFINSLGDNFAKKDASNIVKDKWETALGLGEYVKSVTSTDNFIKVDNANKQNPKLSLDTEKLASDKTFVTNIAGNNDFTTKLGDTFVTKTNLKNSSFKFAGDDTANVIEKKLGGTISIKGGADSTKLSDSNIGVVKVSDSLQVKLAKNLLGLESAEFTKGSDTTTVSAEKGVSTTKTLKVTDGSGNMVAEIDNTQIKDADGKAVTNINSAINNLYTTTKGLTSDNALAVKYDSADKKQITLGGSGAIKQVAIKNLASAGDINKAENKFNAVNAGDLKNALSGVNNSIANINNRNFISLSVSANGDAKDDIKAKENIDFTATDGIKVAYDKNVNKFTFSADAGNNVFSNKYAMLDGSNLDANKGFSQSAWRTALGLTDSDIANIFEGKNGISIDKNGNKYTIGYVGGGTGTGGINEKKVKEIIKEYIGGDIAHPANSNDKLITHDVSERKTTENKSIIAAINRINKYGIGFVHVNGGDLALDASGKSKNDSSAKGENAIAIGPKSQANGENSITIGVDNVVTGKNSYAAGNDNTVESDNTFVLGNKVTVGAGMQGAVVLGNDSKADKAIEVSRAEVNGITYDGFKGQAAGGMILSVGANGAERQIKNVAAGEISENSTDAVNGSQLYATNNIIGNVANSVKNVIGGNVKVNNNGEISASNIGGTDQPTINDAIASINNKINSGGKSYIAIDVPTNGGGVPIASKGSNSIVIGAGSSDNGRKNVVSVGNAKTGLNRTITNVAPGKYGTDAVNMNQLYGVAGGLSKQINDVKKKSSAGIAGAVALGMLPQSNIPGDALVSIGTGYHDSESAVALGISKTSDNARWIFKGGVSYDSQDEVTAGASVGFHF